MGSAVLSGLLVSFLLAPQAPPQEEGWALSPAAEIWRHEMRTIDLHMHVGRGEGEIARALAIMDAVGVGVGANLGAGTVTRHGDEPSAFEVTRDFFEEHAPGRFVQYMVLDYSGWDDEEWSEGAVRQIEEGHRLGTAGLKEFKRLGLTLRDGAGQLIAIDDPKLDPVWKRCGELGLPISIHTSDPKAFWAPYDPSNERWEELGDHPGWWFGDPEKYPSREALLAARNRVIERHPGTTFVCVHFANNPEDVTQVGEWLDRFPNMMVDLAARIPELGRHEPAVVREVFLRHQDRIFFGTDFMSYGKFILGSGGDGPPPSAEVAKSFYRKQWRWLETLDEDFEHMTPIQGNWTIDGIGLPDEVLRKIYFDNAAKLVARSLPPPIARAKRIETDLMPGFGDPTWEDAAPVRLEYGSLKGDALPRMSTEVRLLWSDDSLWLRYSCPFTELFVFDPPQREEREGLWERDVVEAFIGAHPEKIERYLEFEVAPNGEHLDLAIDLPDKDLPWNSGFTSTVEIDEEAKRWRALLRIPLRAFDAPRPEPGTRWRMNLYRCDRANRAFLAWRPALQGSFHTPERFGILQFD